MLSQLDYMAFEQERTMPYSFSPYPNMMNPREEVLKEAREKLVQLEKFIKENK